MDEIEEFAMAISRSRGDDHAVSYRIRNLQSVYDVSYYANAIDVHIDGPVEIAVNTLQLNALIGLLNRLLDGEAPFGEKSPEKMATEGERSGVVKEMNEVPQVSRRDPQQSSIHSQDTQSSIHSQVAKQSSTHSPSPTNRKAITKQFDVNAIALSVGSISFAYYTPLHLLPSSYQRGGNTPYLGEEKQRETATTQWDLSKYAVE